MLFDPGPWEQCDARGDHDAQGEETKGPGAAVAAVVAAQRLVPKNHSPTVTNDIYRKPGVRLRESDVIS